MIDKKINTTNEALMARVAAGDKHAFEALLYRYQQSIINFIFRFLGDRSEAEDLTQEVFLSVWKSAGTYKPKAKFTTWLYRIAVNLCINRQRSLRIRKWFTASNPDSRPQAPNGRFVANMGVTQRTPEDDLMQLELSQQMRKALAGLPTSQRLAVILKLYDELSYHEIARILGRSVSAVDSLLVRAKKKLRKDLTDS
jgi:RNA polymerase sigma-70 factor (ECF subfamily)